MKIFKKKIFRILFITAAALLSSLILSLIFFTKFEKFHRSPPWGCDSFGYLNSAKAVSSNTLFRDHVHRPFLEGLRNHLKANRDDFVSPMNILSPYAYHYDEPSGKIVNQYPPGTGLLLSIFPFDRRASLSPPVSVIILMSMLLLAFYIDSRSISLPDISISVITAAIFYFAPVFTQQYHYVNSLTPTFGILLAAGYLLAANSRAAFLLLGFSVLFRISNIIMFLPLLLAHFYARDIRTPQKAGRELSGTLLYFFAGGFGFLLLYNMALLERVALSAYSSSDLSHNLKIFDNMVFYLSLRQPWFMLHIILLSLVTFNTFILKIPKKWLIFSLLLTAYNYSFYFIHDVVIHYYPHASALLIMGILIYQYRRKFNTSGLRYYLLIPGIILLLLPLNTLLKCLIPTWKIHPKVVREEHRAYADCFSEYDIVWADLYSGTIEYAASIPSFRYANSTKDARQDIMQWLDAAGYKQAIWKTDLEKSHITGEYILQDLSESGLEHKYRIHPDFGEILEIRHLPAKTVIN